VSLFLVAYAAVLYFDHDDAVTITAVGGGESGYVLTAAGDPWRNYTNPLYRIWACGDYTSFGWAQINLRWNQATVRGLSGIGADPCALAQWLYDPFNCARAARQVLASQGFTAWAAYNNGAYRDHLEEARAMVDFLSVGIPGEGPFFPPDPPVVAVKPPDEAVIPPADPVEPP